LALLVVVGVGASKFRQKNAELEKERVERAEYQAELADATPVQVGVLSASQRIHSELYTNYKERNNNTQSAICWMSLEAQGRLLNSIFWSG
jgi:hypothetical protein